MGRANNENRWMQSAFKHNKGALHRSLEVPMGEKIPLEKMEKAAHSNNPLLRRRAQAALNARESLK